MPWLQSKMFIIIRACAVGILLIGPVLLFFKRCGGSSFPLVLDVSYRKLTFWSKSHSANDSESWSADNSRLYIDAHCLGELRVRGVDKLTQAWTGLRCHVVCARARLVLFAVG